MTFFEFVNFEVFGLLLFDLSFLLKKNIELKVFEKFENDVLQFLCNLFLRISAMRNNNTTKTKTINVIPTIALVLSA